MACLKAAVQILEKCRSVSEIPPQTEKLKKMKSKGQKGSVESKTYLCYDVNG